MPTQPRSAFMPVLPEQEGPFSSQLKPPSPIRPVVPGGGISKPAAAAALFSKFFEGVGEGREQAYKSERSARSQKMATLDSYMANNVWNNPNLTDDAKQQASQIYYQAMARHGAEVMGDEYPSKGGKPLPQGRKKPKSEEPEGIGGHLKAMAKQVLVGMSGGKLPEQLPDVGDAISQIQQSLFTKDGINPQFDREGQYQKQYKEAQTALGELGPDASLQAVVRATRPMMDQMRRLDPQRAEAFYKSLGDQYLSMGSPEFSAAQFDRSFQAPPNAPTGPEGYPANVRGMAGEPQAGPPLNPQAPALTPQQFAMGRTAKRISEPIQAHYTDNTGAKTKGLIFEAATPKGYFPYALDQNGNPYAVDPSSVVKAGVGEDPAAMETKETAIRLWRELHADDPDYDPSAPLTATQETEAIRQYKEAVEPSDVAVGREYANQQKQLMIEKIKEDRQAIEDAADEIVAGRQPPDIRGFYGKTAAIRGALAKRKYDFRTAYLDWMGDQKWISTMNSTQITRLRQATQFAYESLDLIDQLSGDLTKKVPWARTKYPIFNAASLAAARSGALDNVYPGARIAANQLAIQIRDLQQELSVVYKGGGTPTDQGIKQAMEMLDGNWDAERLKAATDLARTNLKYRINSLRNTPAVGATEGKGGVGVPGGGGSALNNPGNLMKDGQFMRFNSAEEGSKAVRDDLAAKISGKTTTGLNANSTILDLAKVWAPAGHGANNPPDWAKAVAQWMNVPVTTPIGSLKNRLDDFGEGIRFAEGSRTAYVRSTGERIGDIAPQGAGQQAQGGPPSDEEQRWLAANPFKPKPASGGPQAAQQVGRQNNPF